MSEVQKLIQERLARNVKGGVAEQARFSINLDVSTNYQLEYLAQRLNLSKSACAAILIDCALKDAESAINSSKNNEQHKNSLTASQTIYTKSPKTNLRVIMPDGSIFENQKAINTFVQVIAALNVEKVKALGLKRSRVDIVSTEKHPRYKQSKLGSYYIMSHTCTEEKKNLLEEIAHRLGVDIKIEITSQYDN